MVVEGAQPAALGGDEGEGINITLQDAAGAKGKGKEAEDEEEGAQQGAQQGEGEAEVEERRELVIANQSRLHPGERAWKPPCARVTGSASVSVLLLL